MRQFIKEETTIRYMVDLPESRAVTVLQQEKYTLVTTVLPMTLLRRIEFRFPIIFSQVIFSSLSRGTLCKIKKKKKKREKEMVVA